MRKRESGFTLIELLTVIAIIAILAAILLPVLGRAREQGRRSVCTSNLHQIAVAIRIYKQDNRQFPWDKTQMPALPAHWYGNNLTNGDGWGLGALFPDYVPSLKAFNCPNSDISDKDDPSNNYNSYDGIDPGRQGWADPTRNNLVDDIKYRRVWKVLGTTTNPDPTERRQLIWREPPEGTVVTWCHLHRAQPDLTPSGGNPGFRAQDKDLIVTLEGRGELISSSLSGHPWND